jgi:hypothetical protein
VVGSGKEGVENKNPPTKEGSCERGEARTLNKRLKSHAAQISRASPNIMVIY